MTHVSGSLLQVQCAVIIVKFRTDMTASATIARSAYACMHVYMSLHLTMCAYMSKCLRKLCCRSRGGVLLATMARPVAKSARPSGRQASLPHSSGSALSALLNIVKTDPDMLPGATSQRSLRRIRDADAMVDTPYGKVHQQMEFASSDTSKKPIILEYQHPLAMLYHACMHSACLSNLLAPLALSSSPTTPLTLCLYADEVLPGNPLAVTTYRKLWWFYWTVLEFGSATLSNEDMQTCMHGHMHVHAWLPASVACYIVACMPANIYIACHGYSIDIIATRPNDQHTCMIRAWGAMKAPCCSHACEMHMPCIYTC